MIHENHVFVTNVVVIDSTWETMAMNVINRLANATVEFSTIAKIHKYKGFHKGHHLILMSWRCMVHMGMIWIVSLRRVFVFSMIDDWEVIYLSSCIQFFQVIC
jgi:hypothetical protein